MRHGIEVVVPVPGESALKGKDGKGAVIPAGRYRVEFVMDKQHQKKVPTLKPLDPNDTGGNYTINFRKTTLDAPAVVKDARGADIAFGKEGFRTTDIQASSAYLEKGGWKLHLTVKPENYADVDRWLHANHKGKYKLGAGGEPGEKDFTIYIGSRADTDVMVRKMSSEIADLLEENAAGADDMLFTSKIAGRFDVQHTKLGKEKEIRYYGFNGVPYDQRAADVRAGVNYSFARDKSNPEYKAKRDQVRKEQTERMRRMLEKLYGEYFTG